MDVSSAHERHTHTYEWYGSCISFFSIAIFQLRACALCPPVSLSLCVVVCSLLSLSFSPSLFVSLFPSKSPSSPPPWSYQQTASLYGQHPHAPSDGIHFCLQHVASSLGHAVWE